MLWVNARVRCHRHAEHAAATGSGNSTPTPNPSTDELRAPHAHSWDSALALRANEELFLTETLSHWSVLAARYLERQPFAGALSAADLVHLICKEETNAFCMYLKATGIFPYPGPQDNRGIPYGLALHTHASFFNHSGLPNVMHGPDHVSRMVMHATRHIAPGEECCIAYFDLSETTSLAAMRELPTKFFNFTCDRRRCLWEAGLQQVD